MTTDNTATNFSVWEREVFTAMSDWESVSLPEFRNVVAQGTDPIDTALASIIHDFMVFRYGDGGDDVVEVPANISAARLGDVAGSHHELLEQVHSLQNTYYWGATETLLRETLAVCALIEASADLRMEAAFLAFLNQDILDGIAEQFSNNIREEVENGFITHITEDDINALETAVERLADLSRV